MISGRTGGWPRRFTDAGHLALDAVVAFVDDELPPGPARRAAAHVDHCLSCAAEVAAQRQARRRVRAAGGPAVPSSLLSALCSIPHAAPLPEPPAGLAVGPDGELVVPAETPRGRRARRRSLGVPVALSSGVVVGAAALAALSGPAVVSGTAPASSPGAPVVVAPTVTPTAAAADLAVRARTATSPAPGLPGPGAP
ncbi:zf-HC2 domain-containing protein [Actinomycetospora straminea]|uniref:Putative zinc-finger domain-containing protein n=1 Tax=Actinomycetospora straminea TaxID=663607 RepID=A0ABP9E1N2_9PSEU|nr:zf-HC2 domain-containing protein [Actinomycetospora straminea]MDD7930830.1 zf-HC2 domain-containing protein [Actinomycetospora straminea]